MMKVVFELAAYECFRDAPDCLSATLLAAQRPADVVFVMTLDWVHLADDLRQFRGMKDAVFICVTAYELPFAKPIAARAGFHHCLIKPVQIDGLLDLLEKICSAKKRALPADLPTIVDARTETKRGERSGFAF